MTISEMFRILHQTPTRLRLKVSAPLTPSVQQWLEERLKSEDRHVRLQAYTSTQTLVIHHPQDTGPNVIQLLASLTLDQFQEASRETVDVRPASAYEIIRRAFVNRVLYKLVVPQPIRHFITLYNGLAYLKNGFKQLSRRQLGVEVLDAAAIWSSILRGQLKAASSIHFLLSLSERLEENTVKTSHQNLRESLALSMDRVWRVEGEEHKQVKVSAVQVGDCIAVNQGNLIPFDGEVVSGTVAINEASLTGEAFPVHKGPGASIYANTVVEEGDLIFKVTRVQSETAIAKLVDLITGSENLKAPEQKKLENLANRLVKFNFLGLALTYMLTGNLNKALSFLWVDFSCALRLVGPLTYLTALQNASDHGVIIKGAKFIENFSEIDTYIFDKTGTLTTAYPVVRKVVPFAGYDLDQVIGIAACLEEHYHHPIAEAIVRLAEDQAIEHDEMHATISYIAAHGIESTIDGKRVTIGSKHFILEDEGTPIDDSVQAVIDQYQYEDRYNLLYLAYDGSLIGIFCIDTMLRPEAQSTLATLKDMGKRLILLTGDQANRAQAFVEELGIDFDLVHSEVTPDGKYQVVQSEQDSGRRVLMVGDGINDAAALSQADIGIVLKDTSALAHQVSDLILNSDCLSDLIWLNELSLNLNRKLHKSSRFILGFNGGLILAGLAEWLNGTAIAFLHNLSTFALSFASLRPLLDNQGTKSK